MYKGRNHAAIISTIMFLVLLLTTQILATKAPPPTKKAPPPTEKAPPPAETPLSPPKKVGFLKCFGICAAGCIPLATPPLKGFCVGHCLENCILKKNRLQGIDDSKSICVHEKCIHHLTEAEDLKKDDIDRYVNCVEQCDNHIGESDNSSQLRDSPVADIEAP